MNKTFHKGALMCRRCWRGQWTSTRVKLIFIRRSWFIINPHTQTHTLSSERWDSSSSHTTLLRGRLHLREDEAPGGVTISWNNTNMFTHLMVLIFSQHSKCLQHTSVPNISVFFISAPHEEATRRSVHGCTARNVSCQVNNRKRS